MLSGDMRYHALKPFCNSRHTSIVKGLWNIRGQVIVQIAKVSGVRDHDGRVSK